MLLIKLYMAIDRVLVTIIIKRMGNFLDLKRNDVFITFIRRRKHF
jgi:hypothetical protein